MKSSKSINSLAGGGQQQQTNGTTHNETNQINRSTASQAAADLANKSLAGPTSPICRCRVMYLGSSVPHITKDGLQGIQEPLRELYPDKATLASGNAGIDSWLSVWSNGILIENVDETGREVKRFFKIDALHYCAAVKYVSLPNQPLNPYSTLPTNASIGGLPKFLPLDSIHARQMNSNPPIFASILRRTTGIKVLECHAFICKREAAANALVRCCFHAYADTMYAKQIGADVNSIASDINNNSQIVDSKNQVKQRDSAAPAVSRRSKSIAALNEPDPKKVESWNMIESSDYTQPIGMLEAHERNMMIRRKSMNEQRTQNCDSNGERLQINNDNLRSQQKFSKSMHHLNQGDQFANMLHNQMNRNHMENINGFGANSTSCANLPGVSCNYQDSQQLQQVPKQPFYDPQVARVPNYPPQNLIDAASAGGTLRSIKSMAANSIASTLLRSKKHAKAMSNAQLNQPPITSFHQPHSNVNTIGGLMTMPPVPPMFLPNLQARPPINGSQTMKVSSRSMMPIVGPPMNFEAMTPKEMKKLLKKSAKYGIDPSKFSENGLPILPIHQPPPCHIPMQGDQNAMFHDIYGSDTIDMASIQGLSTPRMPMLDGLDQSQMKPILVKPNSEFLKSKAGKKWLKQQKEFKKLLPPHLDGLPIIFGPPPLDALEPAMLPSQDVQPPAFIPPPIPMMDSAGYYNPHPFYGHNGRASTASTLLRYSPHSQMMYDNPPMMNQPYNDTIDYYQRNNIMYNGAPSSSSMGPRMRDHFVDGSNLLYADGRSFIEPDNRGSRRNHMVEQSVISLGDENDYDDDDHDQHESYETSHQGSEKSHQQHRSMKHLADHAGTYANYQENGGQLNYDQVLQSNDDQDSYSSGINRREHLNERAFSYSIRQEHKSSSSNNSDMDYSSRRGTMNNNQDSHINYNSQHQANLRHARPNQHGDHYRENNGQQSIPVNELTARLENQLNMKSFVTSRIKSNM